MATRKTTTPATPAKPPRKTPVRKAPARTPVARAESAVAAAASRLPIGTLAIGAGIAALAGAALYEWFIYNRAPEEGHAAPDLAADTHPDGRERAPAHFRPDMDAPMTDADREALRPALSTPSLVGGGTGFLPGGIGSN